MQYGFGCVIAAKGFKRKSVDFLRRLSETEHMIKEEIVKLIGSHEIFGFL